MVNQVIGSIFVGQNSGIVKQIWLCAFWSWNGGTRTFIKAISITSFVIQTSNNTYLAISVYNLMVYFLEQPIKRNIQTRTTQFPKYISVWILHSFCANWIRTPLSYFAGCASPTRRPTTFSSACGSPCTLWTAWPRPTPRETPTSSWGWGRPCRATTSSSEWGNPTPRREDWTWMSECMTTPNPYNLGFLICLKK